jgi:CRP-like cAMP-binding protein
MTTCQEPVSFTDFLEINACFRHLRATTAPKTTFSELISEEAAIFGSFCDVITLESGMSTLEADTCDDSLYIVIDGTLSVASPETPAYPPTLVGPGEVLGETAFLLGSPQSLTATAKVRTRLLRCLRWRWDDLQLLYPGVAAKIVWDLASNLAARTRPAALAA